MLKSMKLAITAAVAAAAFAAIVPEPAQARDGCGPGWYRGPGGACHRIGYGPGYDYWYGAPRYFGPQRWWRGGGCWQGRWGHWHCG
jgi:hypothetical protein